MSDYPERMWRQLGLGEDGDDTFSDEQIDARDDVTGEDVDQCEYVRVDLFDIIESKLQHVRDWLKFAANSNGGIGAGIDDALWRARREEN